MKGLWVKYPNSEMDYVKSHKVIGIKRIDENNLIVRKLMHCKMYRMMSSLTLEELHFDFKNEILISKTKFLDMSVMVPAGIEEMNYRAEQARTICTKIVHGSKLDKYVGKFNDSFKKGCEIVEKKTEDIVKSIAQTQNM